MSCSHQHCEAVRGSAAIRNLDLNGAARGCSTQSCRFYPFCGSMSGQLGDDRSERIGGVGADDKVGKPLSSRRLRTSSMAAVGSLGSTESESAARSAAGSVSGDVMNGATASPTTGTWSASSTSRIARKSAAIRMLGAGDGCWVRVGARRVH